MRDYAKVSPLFWTGRTGMALKGDSMEAVIVGLYLMTSPHANMIGVFHCPLAYIAFDTGLGIEGATKGLRSAIEAGFCIFDESSNYVFVLEFAAYQIGDELDAKDLRCKGVNNELAKVPKGECRQGFIERYAAAFKLEIKPSEGKKTISPLQAPTKPGAGAGTGTGERKRQTQPATRKRAAAASQLVGVEVLLAEGVDAQVAADWFIVRKQKKLPLTLTAWNGVKDEAVLAGMTPAVAIKTATLNGWGGFKASWLEDSQVKRLPSASNTVPPAETTAQYVARMAAEAKDRERTPEQLEAARIARDAALGAFKARKASAEIPA